jgi:hypothetical protein
MGADNATFCATVQLMNNSSVKIHFTQPNIVGIRFF